MVALQIGVAPMLEGLINRLTHIEERVRSLPLDNRTVGYGVVANHSLVATIARLDR